MALKSTVLAPPPAPAAPRATTVLRVGPPPKKGLLDLALGIVGLLLLFATVGMAVALPHKDVLPQQFNVVYLDTPVDLPTQEVRIEAGKGHDYEYQVEADDVYLITVKYGFADDIAASAADQFSLRLYDPNGNAVSPQITVVSLPAQGDQATAQCQKPPVGEEVCAYTEYKAQRFNGQFSVVLPKPADDIVEVQDQSLTEKQLAAQLQAKAHTTTKGTWKVKVSMPINGAGGCTPPSGASQDDANRFAACMQELQAAQDPSNPNQAAAQGIDSGNKFSVDLFTYTSFVADAKKIG